MHDLYEYHVCVFTFKIIHGLLPLCSDYVEFNNNANYNLRNLNVIKHQYCRTSLREKFATFTACNFWNKLSSDLKSAHCIHRLKKIDDCIRNRST